MSVGPHPKEEPEVVATEPDGRATYAYRGATITSNAKGTVFTVTLAGAPFDGWKGECDLALPCALVDSWLDYGKHQP
jgi:hypothetical protein